MAPELRQIYATAFEIDTSWIIEAAARRQKWIDQAQSLNIYMAGASGKKLDDTYKLAWLRGLKTTDYLRTLAATSAEKSTGRGGELNAVSAAGAGQPGGALTSRCVAPPDFLASPHQYNVAQQKYQAQPASCGQETQALKNARLVSNGTEIVQTVQFLLASFIK